MHTKTLLVSLLGALAFSGAAQAAVLSSSDLAGSNLVTDYSGDALVSFDLDLAQLRNTKLTYTIEAADLDNPYLNLNALVRNLSGAGLRSFGFKLDGISFAGGGSVNPTFGTIGSQWSNAQALNISFSAPEWAELHIGNPFVEAGKLDWRLSTAGLSVGDQFTITSDVPEPGNLALMLAGLGAFAFVKRRRARR